MRAQHDLGSLEAGFPVDVGTKAPEVWMVPAVKVAGGHP